MRPATAQELPEEQALFTRSWDLLKRYANITQEDEKTWEKLIQETESMYRKGQNEAVKVLTECVMDGVIRYLTIRSKEKKRTEKLEKEPPKFKKDRECLHCTKMFDCKGKPADVLQCLNFVQRKLPE